MSELSLKKPPHRPSAATTEQKGAIHGVLSLYPRRSKEFRVKRNGFAQSLNVHPKTIDNWFAEIERLKTGNSAEGSAA